MEQDRNCQKRLLGVAVKAFAVRSYDGVSLRALAAAADCDVSVVAQHFGSKQDLWLAKYPEHVKTGLPGIAHVRLDQSTPWPEALQVRLP